MHKRSIFGGATDYTGVSIEDIHNDLKEWKKTTEYTITELKELRAKLIANKDGVYEFTDILSFIDFSINLFSRFLYDFTRLISEIPKGVQKSHIETIAQIYNRSKRHDRICVNFKRDHIEKDLKDESLRPLIDSIYAETRDELINYYDLSNVKMRLRALVGISMIDEKLKNAYCLSSENVMLEVFKQA